MAAVDCFSSLFSPIDSSTVICEIAICFISVNHIHLLFCECCWDQILFDGVGIREPIIVEIWG